MTQDEVAKRFDECRKQWELAKWDAVQACYAADASFEALGSGMPSVTGGAPIVALMQARRAAFPDEKAQPQLVLVNGRRLVGISIITGKNTGPLKTPKGESPATGRPIGLYLGEVVRFDDAGKVTHESDYLGASFACAEREALDAGADRDREGRRDGEDQPGCGQTVCRRLQRA